MASQLRVDEIIASTGSSVAIGTAGGSVTLAGDFTVDTSKGLNVGTGATIFSPSSNVLTLGTNSAERVRITSTGNVGIGTETPTGLLHLNNSNASSYTTLRISNSGASGRIFEIGVGGNTAASTSYQNKLYIYDSTAGQPRVALDSSGNFGLGTLSPAKKFHVWESTGSNLFRLNGYNSYNLDISNTNDNGATYDFAIGSGAAQFSFSGSSGELLRITSAGNLKFASSGSGIDFSATSDASGSTSELLDDYEEGTWTPTLNGFTNAGIFQTAEYIKIGRKVTVYLNIFQSSNNMSFTATSLISGLPFTTIANFHTAVSAVAVDVSENTDIIAAWLSPTTPVVKLKTASSSRRHILLQVSYYTTT